MKNFVKPIHIIIAIIIFSFIGQKAESVDYDSEDVPYDLQGLLVFVYDDYHKEYFAGHVMGKYKDRVEMFDVSLILAYRKAHLEHLNKWKYSNYTITSKSNSATRVRLIKGQQIPSIIKKYNVDSDSISSWDVLVKAFFKEYMLLLEKIVDDLGENNETALSAKVKSFVGKNINKHEDIIKLGGLKRPGGALIAAHTAAWAPGETEINTFSEILPSPELPRATNEYLIQYIESMMGIELVDN